MTIIVPYRIRQDHLAQFIPHMRAYLPDAKIVIVEQVEGKEWNREKLFNVSVREYPDYFYVCHDVDMLPLKVDYSPRRGVTQLASSTIQRYGYMGGVTMFDHDTYVEIGGYHNEYWGGRGGDNEMYFNLQHQRIWIRYLPGKFRSLPHPRSCPEFIPGLWEKAQHPREVQDQLSACEYRVISRKECETHTHIIVDI